MMDERTREAAMYETEYRFATYANLSALFADAPKEDALEDLIAMAVDTDPADCSRQCEGSFYAYLAGLGRKNTADLRRDIASEYAELFIGPRPPLAPYYESIYRGFPNRLFTDRTMAVQEFYASCGFEVIKSGKVPGDNVAYELEFMSHLAKREAEAIREEKDEVAATTRIQQLKFLTQHLGSWIGLLAARIADTPCGDFYKETSAFAAEFIKDDIRYLSNEVNRAREDTDSV